MTKNSLNSLSEGDNLASKIQRGDTEAFAEVFRQNYLPLVEFVSRIVRNDDSAHDIVQDVFFQLWERRDTIDPTKPLRAYLYTLARNRAYNQVEHSQVVKRHQETTLLSSPDAESASNPSPDDLVSADELIRLAEQSVATLSPRLREIYDLSRNHEMSPAEIAQVLGVSVQTVYTQLTRITRELYPVLRRWIDDG